MIFSRVNSAIYTHAFSSAHVLAQQAYLHSARKARASRLFKTYFGAEMAGDIGDFVQARIFSFGVWEPSLSRFIETKVGPDTWAVDVGAHVGYFTLLMSALAPHGHVTAIEAAPSTYRQLVRHLAMNGCENVTAINKAVTASRGEVKLFRSQWGAGNTGNNSLIEPKTPTAYSIVQSDTLLNILGGDAGRVSFMKIDVEGAERPILEMVLDNQDAFAANLTLVAEVSDDNLDLVNRFLAAGFRCSVLNNFYGLDAYLSKRVDTPEPWRGKRHPSADFIFERGVAA